MPGNSWQNLGSRLPSVSSSPVASAAPAVPPEPVANLLRQRQELEANLRRLVTGENADARDAARFQVPTFAQRQAQQREWDRQREAQLQQLRTREADVSTRLPSSLPSLETMRTGLHDFNQPVGQWMNQRDQARERSRRAVGSVRSASQPLRNLGDQVHSAADKLRDLDRQLASEGLEDDRQALRDAGADKLLKADKTLEKINSVFDAPQRASDQIDSFWQRRQEQISGAMDRSGPYVDRLRQRLSVESGGSGDLFQRMQQNRERALERRREQRKQEQLEESKRQRAQQRKREKEE